MIKLFFWPRPQRSLRLLGLIGALTLSPLRAYAQSKPYRVEFRGVENLLQLRSLRETSNLIRYRKTGPRSMAALQYRANTDIPSFLEIMHAYGYYDACIYNKTVSLPSGKYKIVVSVDKGTRYRLQQFNLSLQESDQPLTFPLKRIHLRDLGLKLKTYAVSTKIVTAKEKLINKFTQKGYPFAKFSSEKIIVDQALKTMAVNLQVNTGPLAYFGPIYLETQSKVSSKYIRNRIKWKHGEVYSSETIKRTEKALYDTGLFSVVSITPGDELIDCDELPITIQLIDAKHNGLTLGGSYTTTWEGFGGQAIWQNRNIFSTGTDLRLNYTVNQKLQEAGLQYSFPDFLSKNQIIVASSSASKNVQPNYIEKAVKTDLYLERILSKHFKTSIGVKFDQLETTESDHNGYFSLFGIPYHFNTQSSENVLINPTNGGWANLGFIPYFSMRENDRNFTELKLEGSVYQFLIPSRKIVLAMNMVFGTLFGESNFDIPAPYRFYAGSPSHLRGYPYQEVSPLDAEGKPIGGRSMFLWSIEPRIMILESVMIAGFMDVGNVYTTSWPNWKDAMLKSLGVGVRYFSFIGPLRLDIGFPMNDRPNVKKKYQIYFSFGQPF